jgi:hypothetical protein
MSRVRGFVPDVPHADTETMDGTDTSTKDAAGDREPADIAPVDIQRLLTWYFDVLHPGRRHITSRRRVSRLHMAEGL